LVGLEQGDWDRRAVFFMGARRALGHPGNHESWWGCCHTAILFSARSRSPPREKGGVRSSTSGPFFFRPEQDLKKSRTRKRVEKRVAPEPNRGGSSVLGF
jgi:hypothetical protein